MSCMFLHRANCGHMVLDRIEEQKPLPEKNAQGLLLHVDPTERESGDQEEEAVHIRYSQQALGCLL